MIWRRFLTTLLIVGLATAACGRKARVTVPTDSVARQQEGLASWYGKGDGFHGRPTASGERFDRDKLTAAHYTLPFGTRVRVRNKKNGRQVVVRINDRTPLATLEKGRIIDLSYRAAQELDMVRDGVVPVVLEVIS